LVNHDYGIKNLHEARADYADRQDGASPDGGEPFSHSREREGDPKETEELVARVSDEKAIELRRSGQQAVIKKHATR
jgi:hypothetical protein